MEQHVVQAPDTLGRETHAHFRREVLEVLEATQPSDRWTQLVIDLSATREVDSAGLGAMVLIQRRAAEIRRAVYLRGVLRHRLGQAERGRRRIRAAKIGARSDRARAGISRRRK